MDDLRPEARPYRRVSTDEQSLGLEAQLHACRVWADREGFRLTEPFTDEDVSGASPLDKRPAMLEALASLKTGDVLLVSKRDRLGREPMAIAMIEAAARRKKCRIISAAGEGTENDDPSSILMRRMIDAFSEFERLIIKARTKAALDTKARKGERISGRIPYGHDLAGDGIHLVANEAEREAIDNMHSWRAEGVSANQIANKLNVLGVPAKEGGLWSGRTVLRILARHARTHKVA